jgi:hypothetical protein
VPGTPGSAPAGAPGWSALRRLTAREYNNTVRDLLGNTSAPNDQTTAIAAGNFETSADTFSISSPLVEQLLTIAEGLARAADPARLAPCDAGTTEAACARLFVQRMGRRTLRRPLETAEVDDYVALYTRARADNDQPTTLRALLTRMLISPEFLYHVERGEAAPADGSSPLVTPYELASRLSYLLWQTMPDEALFAAADSGALRARPQVLAQAQRLLGDPRARDTMWRFHEQWLQLAQLATTLKDAVKFKGFNTEKADLAEGMHRFVDDVAWRAAGDLGALLTSSYTFANARLAPLYGYAVTDAAFTRVDLDARQAAGVLGQPALMAALAKPDKSAPILRGVFVRERILCAPLPPPPANAGTIPADAPPAKTTREFFANLTKDPACAACHGQINPIGYGLENFDAIGKWRDSENGVPIDASGELTVSDMAGKFVGPVELAQKLARSRDVATCYARQWFRFGFSRFDADGDAPFVKDIADRFGAAGNKLATMPALLTQAEPFYRLHYTTRGQ